MARYSAVHTVMWDDEKYLELNTLEKLVFVYLLTSPHGNSAGLYRLPIAYAAEDMGEDFEGVRDAIQTLCDRGLIAYDKPMRIVWIKNFILYNKLTNPKHAKGAATVSADYVKSPLYSDFYARVNALHPNYIEHFTKPMDRVSQDYENPKPMDSLSNGYRNTDTVTDTVTDTETVPIIDDDDDTRVSEKDREELEAQCVLTFGECSEHKMQAYMVSLVAWASIYGVKMVLNALIATHEQQGEKLNYTAAVLQDWKDRGYKTGDEYWGDELKKKGIIREE